jgi:hypothetical protein
LFSPSVSRIACRCTTCGTEVNSTPAMSSQVEISVPPPERSLEMASVASARVASFIGTIAGPELTSG